MILGRLRKRALVRILLMIIALPKFLSLYTAIVLFTGAAAAQPALTIYNGGFAVVRERVPLDLKAGVNSVNFSGATMHLEPDSVVLRDPTGKVSLRVLEQNYRADTISQGLLLSLNEGKVVDFRSVDAQGRETIVHGRVLRSGYEPNLAAHYGQRFYQQQVQAGNSQPIIEVDGHLRFSLPGEPIFSALGDDAILKPLLTWQLASDTAAKVDAELSYITGGLSWEASYNLIAPEKSDTLDLIGWVTIDNQSGRQFDTANVKLMAGDVNKLVAESGVVTLSAFRVNAKDEMESVQGGATEKAFDEFHLYTLRRPATLRNRETKQVELIRATGIHAKTIYIYRGLELGQYRNWNMEAIRNNREYGTQSNPKVAVMREFENTEANGLGQPLPKGRTRFYRRDEADGRLEFTGENLIDHTAKNETVRIYTGDAFDVTGARRRVSYSLSNSTSTVDESFEITLHNRKDTPVEVRVAERLYRWVNWTITAKTHDFIKTDSQDVEFRVNVPADGETVVRYTVHYDWK